MADGILPNQVYSEKLKDNELIYFGALICDIITEVEHTLITCLNGDYRLRLLLSVKNKWVNAFNNYKQ